MTMYKIQIIPRTLHFKQPAGTSRGIYTTRKLWYIHISDTATGQYGVGECAPLPALSCDDIPNYEEVLARHCRETEVTGTLDYNSLRPYPSMLFGLETALQHLHSGSLQLWHTSFSEGREGIPINGLIWMGNFDEMYHRIEEKMRLGFRCIKVKIGAIDFDKELELLAHIRRHFTPEQIELRVDANGAFSPSDAPEKLKALSQFHLHSIEQPIRAVPHRPRRRIDWSEYGSPKNRTARNCQTAIYHPETFAPRRAERCFRMDYTCITTGNRILDYLSTGIECRTERHRTMVCHSQPDPAARTGNRTAVYGQHRFSAPYQRRLPVVRPYGTSARPDSLPVCINIFSHDIPH